MPKTWLQFDNISLAHIIGVEGTMKPDPYTDVETKCFDIHVYGGVTVTLWEGGSTFKKFLEWWKELGGHNRHKLAFWRFPGKKEAKDVQK